MKNITILALTILLGACEPSINFKGDPKEICVPNGIETFQVTSSEVFIKCFKEQDKG